MSDLCVLTVVDKDTGEKAIIQFRGEDRYLDALIFVLEKGRDFPISMSGAILNDTICHYGEKYPGAELNDILGAVLCAFWEKIHGSTGTCQET